MRGTLIVLAVCALLVALGVLAPGVLNAGFDALDLALGWLGPFTVIVLVSAGVGLLFLVALPHVSPQGAVKAVKDKIKFNLLAIRLFQDNLGSVVRSTAATLGWNFAYIGLNLVPLFALAGPFMIVWFQLNALYAYEPFEPGDRTTVVVELRDDVDPHAVGIAAAGSASDGAKGWESMHRPFRLDDAGERALVLDLEAGAPGGWELAFTYEGETIAKNFEVGTAPRRLSRIRTATPLAKFTAAKDAVLWFGERPVLPDDAFVQSVQVVYPAAGFGVFGSGEIAVMIVFVLVSLVVAFALKGVFGVEI
ncbi:MAG TPA: hypothetical protein VGC54_09765 [Planctomycetota bacterium]